MSRPTTAERQRVLLHGPIGRTLIDLAAPMALGIAAIMLFNVVDTFWVGQLGARELAAMTFTFPVVAVVFSVTMGIGIGATAVIARAIGQGDGHQVRRLTTDALLLANAVVIVVALLGLLTLDPLFRALGADDVTLGLVRDYMVPWYLGVGLLVIPMIGNSAIRATGDTRTPSYVMIVAGLVNAVLDPFLIFGWGPFPRLGLTGAALSTVASYAGAFVVALWILARREKLLTFERPVIADVVASWRRIMRIGLPAGATNMLSPVAAGLLTRMVASHGELAVAAYGVGTRIEGLALIGFGALSTAMTPFVAQNLGAGDCERIRLAIRFGIKAAVAWGGGAALLLMVSAAPLARVFNDQPEVVTTAVAYMVLVPVSYGTLGIAQLIGTSLNALDQPLAAAGLVATRLIVLAVPLAWIGSRLAGLEGLFGGIAVANGTIGFVAIAVVHRHLSSVEHQLDAVDAPSAAPVVA